MTTDFVELNTGTPGNISVALLNTRTAGLRKLVVNDIDIVQGFGPTQKNEKSAGDVLIPWPNRVKDGVWKFNDDSLQLPINEPARHNAIHGLLRDVDHQLVEQTDSHVMLRGEIEPSAGYPFHLQVDTTYSLMPNGIQVRHLIVNRGDQAAPVAIGAHPYLKIGNIPVEDLKVTLHAESRVLVDERLNPTGIEAVDGTRFDLNDGVRVGELDLDTAYCDLVADADGIYRHTLVADSGETVTVWGDSHFKHAQVYTTGDFNTERGPGWAIAIEPTTAPPDAFNSGVDLFWVKPGERFEASWGIELSISR